MKLLENQIFFPKKTHCIVVFPSHKIPIRSLTKILWFDKNYYILACTHLNLQTKETILSWELQMIGI